MESLTRDSDVDGFDDGMNEEDTQRAYKLVKSSVSEILGLKLAPYTPERDVPSSISPYNTTHSCDACGDTFVLASSLDYHLNRRSVEINHHCKVCRNTFIFYNRCNFLTHLRQHKVELTEENLVQVDFRYRPIPKTIAAPVFDPPDLMETILQTFANQDAVSLQTCSSCKLPVRTSMKEHYRGDYVLTLPCDMCHLLLPTNCSLQAHKRVHKSLKPHTCPDCASEFAEAGGLFMHLSECLHFCKFMEYQCKLCKIRFNSTNLLNDHVVHKHFVTSPAFCSDCPENHSARGIRPGGTYSLTRHLSHPYFCQVCSETVQAGHAHSHVQQHSIEPSMVFYGYKCPHCACTRDDEGALKMHINNCPKKKNVVSFPLLRRIRSKVTGTSNNGTVLGDAPDARGMPLTPSPEPVSDEDQQRRVGFAGAINILPMQQKPALLAEKATDKVAKPTGLFPVPAKKHGNFSPNSNVCLVRQNHSKTSTSALDNAIEQVTLGGGLMNQTEQSGIFRKNSDGVAISPKTLAGKNMGLSDVIKALESKASNHSYVRSQSQTVKRKRVPIVKMVPFFQVFGEAPVNNETFSQPNSKKVKTVESNSSKLNVAPGTSSKSHFLTGSVMPEANGAASTVSLQVADHELVDFIKTEPEDSIDLNQAIQTHKPSLASSKRKRKKRSWDSDFVFDGFEHDTEEEVLPESDSDYSGSEQVKSNARKRRPHRPPRSLIVTVNGESLKDGPESLYPSARTPLKRKTIRKSVDSASSSNSGVVERRGRKKLVDSLPKRKASRKSVDSESSSNSEAVERRGIKKKVDSDFIVRSTVKHGVNKKNHKGRGRPKINSKVKTKVFDPYMRIDTTSMDTGLIISTESTAINDFVCSAPQCNFSSEDKELFVAHAKTHRVNDDVYQCLECGVCYEVLSTFTKHLIIKHQINDVDAYINDNDCCDKELLNKKAQAILDQHVPTVLLENQCGTCFIVCEDAAKLATHFRSHGMAFLLQMNQMRRNMQQKKT